MASKFFSERNLRFLLYEVFDVVSLTRYNTYKEYNGKLLDMVLKAAVELTEGLLWSILRLTGYAKGVCTCMFNSS